ncbi:MAG: hypothetical protein AB7G48_16880 [Nitrospiraceae bacterium]
MKRRTVAQDEMPRSRTRFAMAAAMIAVAAAGCARVPYTTQTIYEGPRVVVTAQRTIDEPSFTHPVTLTSDEVAALLKGFSLRVQQRLPLRWFTEEAPPIPVFREDEIELVAPYLVEAFQRIGPDERAHFALLGPGNNPEYGRDLLSGWVAVREPYLYLTVEQYHTQVPVRKADLYYRNYPTPPPPAKDYILYFDPGRFWVTDPKEIRAVELRKFLQSGEAGQGATRSSPGSTK